MKPVKFWSVIALVVGGHGLYLLFPIIATYLPDEITLLDGNVYQSVYYCYDVFTQSVLLSSCVVMLLLMPHKMRFIFYALSLSQLFNLIQFALYGYLQGVYWMNLALLSFTLIYALYNYKLFIYPGIDGSKRYALTMHKRRALDYLLQPRQEAVNEAELIRQKETIEEAFNASIARINQAHENLYQMLQATKGEQIRRADVRNIMHKLTVQRSEAAYARDHATAELVATAIDLKDSIRLPERYADYMKGIETNLKPKQDEVIYSSRERFLSIVSLLLLSAIRNHKGANEEFRTSIIFKQEGARYDFSFVSYGDYSSPDTPTTTMEEKASELVCQLGGQFDIRHKDHRRTIQFWLPAPGKRAHRVYLTLRQMIG